VRVSTRRDTTVFAERGNRMAIFGRKKDDTPATPSADPAPAAVPDAGPAPRPATPQGIPAMSTSAPKPNMPPAAGMPVPPRPMTPTTPGTPGVGMPARPAGRTDAAERRTLVVGRGISLQGTVADAERLVVEGNVESQMIQAAELHIAQSGVFKGEVQVEDADIAGIFDGTITARGSLTIRASGRVSGTVRCRRFSVEEGGQLSGRMEMLTDATAAALPNMPPRTPTA
jgi:cytoskeletal protein CcmA (bactofilin family)